MNGRRKVKIIYNLISAHRVKYAGKKGINLDQKINKLIDS